MDLVQLLLLWSLLVTCNVREISAVVDYKKDWHAKRILRLRKIENRIETPRHLKDSHHRHLSKRKEAKIQGKTVYKDMDCVEKFMCPLPARVVTCITLHDLCDDNPDCPHAEDEDPVSCLFFKMTNHFVIQTVEKAKDILKSAVSKNALSIQTL